MADQIAYIAGGKLHLSQDGQKTRVLASRFAEDTRARAASIRRRNTWKEAGRGAAFQGRLLWGSHGAADPNEMPIAVSALARGRRPGEILYAVSAGAVSGVFSVDCTAEDPEASETRLFHSADHRVTHLGSVEDQDFILCDVPDRRGAACIAVMDSAGSELTELTEGDAIDAAPCWVPGKDRVVVYQSAGIGRDASGAMVGFGPYHIQQLDIVGGEVTPLCDDPQYDFLNPRVAADGTLYCIRRPYRRPDETASAPRAMLDFVLFPFRLLFALLQALNFFTARYTGRPLTTAGGPQRRGADARQMMIWGNLIDAEEAAGADGATAKAVVPGTWQLIRKRGERVDVLAKSVIAFDLCPDGSIVYSNGNALFRLAPGSGARPEDVLRATGITHVLAVR